MVEAPTVAEIAGTGQGPYPTTAPSGSGKIVTTLEEVPVPTLEDWAEILPDGDDESDPNARHHRDTLNKVHAAYNDLPDGWKRARDAHGRHIFVHVPSGRTSFRNPARENVKRVLAEMEAENPELWANENAQKAAKIRKLRRMIKAGTPAHAVEHQAKMDGVDMDEVTMAEEEQGAPTAGRDNAGGTRAAKIRKLRRMIKAGTPAHAIEHQAKMDGVDMDEVMGEAEAQKSAGKYSGDNSIELKRLRKSLAMGVPLPAVQQQAHIRGIDPALLSEKDGAAAPTDGAKKGKSDTTIGKRSSSPGSAGWTNRRFADKHELRRLRKMLSSGVPLPAVQQAARQKGIDPDLISKNDAAEETAPPEEVTDDDTAEPLFRLVEKDGDDVPVPAVVEFDPPDSILASVVRGCVQTLKGRGRRAGGGSVSRLLSVELRKDLYNALGNLRAVRREVDEYNRAFVSSSADADEDKPGEPDDVRRARRRPLLERLKSVGARPPSLNNNNNDDADTSALFDIDGLDSLLDLIESSCSDLVDSRLVCVSDGLADFNSLGEWYGPGKRVVARNALAAGADVLCEVVRSEYEEGRTLFGTTRRFRVWLKFYASVDGAGGGGGGGGKFAPVEFEESMENYDGVRDIRTFSFVPLAGLGRDEAARALGGFRSRGEMYVRCATGGASFLRYEEGSFFPKLGGSFGSSNKSSSFGRNSHAAAQRAGGRIVVDCRGSYEAGHSVGVGFDPMVDAVKAKQREYALYLRRTKQAKASSSAASAATLNGDDDMIVLSSLPDDLLAMTWPALVGFSFTAKVWGDVLVDGLSDITFNESAFDRLVLPPSRKRMIKALVRHSNSSGFSDIIAGKGEGSVFLLYGPPGSGKTLTAEAVSEMLHRPLYAVSLGQLGSTPSELESRLGEILDLCGRWDALVLLDEADIFLEKRTSGGASSSLERNAMVSVMLRLVEYFRGVLFLTSNRVDSLDPAFKTRITLALRYDALTRDARAEVWTNLLRSSGHGRAVDVGTIVPSELAEGRELNGREIKNAVRLAMALAEEDGEPLGHGYLEETADMMTEFNAEMEKVEEY